MRTRGIFEADDVFKRDLRSSEYECIQVHCCRKIFSQSLNFRRLNWYHPSLQICAYIPPTPLGGWLIQSLHGSSWKCLKT